MARCPLPWLNMIVNVDGEVTPCCYWRSYGNCGSGVGNVNQGGFLAAWNSPQYQEARRQIVAGESGTPCEDCVALKTGASVRSLMEAYAFAIDDPRADSLRAAIAEFERGETLLSNPPTALTVATTAACNIDCTFCNQTPQRVQRMRLEDDAVKEILVLSDNLTALAWQGGEALLDPRFSKFIKAFDRARNPLLRLNIVTNGLLATPDFIDLLRSRFDTFSIWFSVDSFDKATYERLRRGSSFDRVMENLRYALKVGNDSPTISISVQACLMKSTITQVPRNIESARREGIWRYNLSPVLAWPPTEALNYFTDFHPQTQGWRQALQEGRDLIAAYGPDGFERPLNAAGALVEVDRLLDELAPLHHAPIPLTVEVIAVDPDLVDQTWPVDGWRQHSPGVYVAQVSLPFATINTVNFEYLLADGDAEFQPGTMRPEGQYRVLPAVSGGQYRVDVILRATAGYDPAMSPRPIRLRPQRLAGTRRRKRHGAPILGLYEGQTLDSPMVAYLPITGPGTHTIQIPREKAQGNLNCLIIDDEVAYYASKYFLAASERGSDGTPLIRIAYLPEAPDPARA